MAPIGRIGERLRLEAQAGVRAVMGAVEARRRAIQLRRVVDLHAGLGAVQLQRQAVQRRAQLGDRRQPGLVGRARGDEIRVVGLSRGVADRARSAEVEGRAGDRADLAGGDQFVVGRRVEVADERQFVIAHVARAVEIEIGVLGEVDDRRPVASRGEFDAQDRRLQQPVDAGRGQGAGKAGVAVGRFESRASPKTRRWRPNFHSFRPKPFGPPCSVCFSPGLRASS